MSAEKTLDLTYLEDGLEPRTRSPDSCFSRTRSRRLSRSVPTTFFTAPPFTPDLEQDGASPLRPPSKLHNSSEEALGKVRRRDGSV